MTAPSSPGYRSVRSDPEVTVLDLIRDDCLREDADNGELIVEVTVDRFEPVGEPNDTSPVPLVMTLPLYTLRTSEDSLAAW
jgi:hypothetical protein